MSTIALLEPYLDQRPGLPLAKRKCFHLFRWKRPYFCRSSITQPAAYCWRKHLFPTLVNPWVQFQIDRLCGFPPTPHLLTPRPHSQRSGKLTDCELGRKNGHTWCRPFFCPFCTLTCLQRDAVICLGPWVRGLPLGVRPVFRRGGQIQFSRVLASPLSPTSKPHYWIHL